MAEQQLDCAHIDTGFEQVNGERVPQTVRRDGFENTAKLVRLPACRLHGIPESRYGLMVGLPNTA